MNSVLSEKRIWVTGASSGIGLSLAEKLVDLGSTVILSSRRTESLEQLASLHEDRVLVQQLDVTDADSVKRAGCRIDERFGGLDIAILNAGTCEYVDSKNLQSELFERVLDVNFLGIVRCTEAALPLLRKGNSPQLVGMCSTVAFAPLPRAEAYGASKAAAEYFLESLRSDLLREEIDVSIIYPGFVKTPLTDKNDFPMPMMVSVEESTRQIIKGITKRKAAIRYPFIFSTLLRLFGMLPVRLRSRLSQRMVKS